MKQRCIVTITDGISPTSMPYNEFVLFRLKHYPEEKQVLIQVFEHGINGNIVIPEDIEYYSLGISPLIIAKTVSNLEEKYDIKAYHIHEGKSVILFSLSTLWKYRNKTIYTLHSTYRNYPFHNKLFSFIASLLARDIVCVSKTSLKYYPSILKFLRGRHAMYIQNGVDIERIMKSIVGVVNKQQQFTLLYVARLVALKRHKILFETMKRLPDANLILIGIGPLEDVLKNEVKAMKIEDRVEFLGLLPREEVYKLLKGVDLYVSSSSYEGLPIGVLEAMGCGVPCLVSNIEQHAEIAELCPSLLLCPDDIKEWVNKIKTVQNMPEKEQERLRIENQRSVEKFFSLSSMHDHYNELYFNN